LGYVLLVLG